MTEADDEVVDLELGELIEPTYGRITIRVETVPERTKSGLWLSPARSITEEKAVQGVVVAIGSELHGEQDDDLSLPPRSFAVGSTVLFGKYTGTKVEYERQTIIVMRETDVLATIRSPEQVRKLRIRG